MLKAQGVPAPTDSRFEIQQNGEVSFKGTHDGYPSYEVWIYKDGSAPQSYLFKEQKIDDLAPPEEISVEEKSFRW